MFEHMEEIVSRVEHAHFLEGAPTDDELETHLPDIIPSTLLIYVHGYGITGNVLNIIVTDSVTLQEMSLYGPKIVKLLNARLGRNAVGSIKARVKK